MRLDTAEDFAGGPSLWAIAIPVLRL